MRISLIELKNVLYNFEWLKLLQLKLKIVNIVLFYLLVKNVHYIHKPDAVDSQLIAIDLTILNYSKKVRSLKLKYIFPNSFVIIIQTSLKYIFFSWKTCKVIIFIKLGLAEFKVEGITKLKQRERWPPGCHEKQPEVRYLAWCLMERF